MTQSYLDEINANYAQPLVQDSLMRIGLPSFQAMLQLFAGTTEDIEGWLADAELNRDRNLRLEYLAGQSLDQQMAHEIYRNMVSGVLSRELSFRSLFYDKPD